MNNRFSVTMDDDLGNKVRRNAAKEVRTLNQQINHLVKLGLKYGGKPIKDIRFQRACEYGHEDLINDFLLVIERSDMFREVVSEQGNSDEVHDAFYKKYRYKIFQKEVSRCVK